MEIQGLQNKNRTPPQKFYLAEDTGSVGITRIICRTEYSATL